MSPWRGLSSGDGGGGGGDEDEEERRRAALSSFFGGAKSAPRQPPTRPPRIVDPAESTSEETDLDEVLKVWEDNGYVDYMVCK